MSRLGNMPVEIPDRVSVSIDGTEIEVSGKKGKLNHRIPRGISVRQEDDELIVERHGNDKQKRSMHGLTRSLLQNMVQGVSEGFEKVLIVEGTGYRVAMSGNKLQLTVGHSHPVEVDPPEGIEIETPSRTRIIVRGIDKQLVGEIAAKIRAIRPPEPYHGHGIRYEGEHIRRKEGKSAVVTTG